MGLIAVTLSMRDEVTRDYVPGVSVDVNTANILLVRPTSTGHVALIIHGFGAELRVHHSREEFRKMFHSNYMNIDDIPEYKGPEGEK